MDVSGAVRDDLHLLTRAIFRKSTYLTIRRSVALPLTRLSEPDTCPPVCARGSPLERRRNPTAPNPDPDPAAKVGDHVWAGEGAVQSQGELAVVSSGGVLLG